MKRLLDKMVLVHDEEKTIDPIEDTLNKMDFESFKKDEVEEEVEKVETDEEETDEVETDVEKADGDELKDNEDSKGKVVDTNWAAAREALAKSKEENKSLLEKVEALEKLVTTNQTNEVEGNIDIKLAIKEALYEKSLEDKKESFKNEANTSLNTMMKDLKLSTKDVESFMVDVQKDYGVDIFKDPKKIDVFKNVYFSDKIIEAERQKMLEELKNPTKTGKVKIQESSKESTKKGSIDKDLVSSVVKDMLKDI